MSFYIDMEQDNTSHNEQKDMQAHLQSQDEVINKTSWRPLKGNGQNFKSHTLDKVSESRLVFKRSLSSTLFYVMIIIFGLTLSLVALFGRVLGMSGSGSPLYGVAVGFLFLTVGVYLYTKGATQINLDSRLKAMWRGKIDAASVINKKSMETYASLSNLHAVQVIQELIRSESVEDDERRSSYYSYEVNLVMNDGERLNVLDHGKKKSIDEDAAAIASLFEVPLWDGCRNFEEIGSGINWMEHILDLVSLGKAIAGVGAFMAIAFFLYNMYEGAGVEEKMLASLTPKEARALSAQATTELLIQVKDANISLHEINILLRKGAYVDVKDNLGRTPLFYAVMQKNFDEVNRFIRIGADIDIKDKEGTSLLNLLDPVQDKFMYYYILDASLNADAQSRGKQVLSIDRKFNATGKMTYQKVHER